jgi:hypothetical protein
MAFTLDQANLGTVVGSTGTISSFTLTTSAAAAAGSIICIAFGWFTVTNTITSWTVSGGGLTWSVPVDNGRAPNGDGCAIAWALAPSGLPSGTVITFTAAPANSLSAPCAVAQSFLGANQSSPQDGTSSKAYGTITAGAWSGNTIAGMTGASDLVFVSAWGDANTVVETTLTPSSGNYSGGLVASQGSAGGMSGSVYAMNVASTPNPSPWGTWGTTGQPTGTAVTAVAFLASGPPPPVYTQNYPKSSYMKARNY